MSNTTTAENEQSNAIKDPDDWKNRRRTHNRRAEIVSTDAGG